MNIIIDDSMTLLSVQEEFNRIFPYLKINFFGFVTEKTNIPQQKIAVKNTRTFSEFRKPESTMHVVITPEMSVSDLEKHFSNGYHLKTQVYRNSGRIWLETNATDSWALEEQNKQGLALNRKREL